MDLVTDEEGPVFIGDAGNPSDEASTRTGHEEDERRD